MMYIQSIHEGQRETDRIDRFSKSELCESKRQEAETVCRMIGGRGEERWNGTDNVNIKATNGTTNCTGLCKIERRGAMRKRTGIHIQQTHKEEGGHMCI